MSLIPQKPTNKRFEALRSQIKNTLFEATQHPSPKSSSLSSGMSFVSPQSTAAKPIQISLPSFEPAEDKGKWLKMTQITQKRNFEMMRTNLKVQMFGKAHDNSFTSDNSAASTQASIDSPRTDSACSQGCSTTKIIECRENNRNTSPDLCRRVNPESLAKFQSLVPAPKVNPSDQNNVLEVITPKSNSVFKKFETRTDEIDEIQSPDHPYIVTLCNNFCEFYEELEILGEGTSGTVKRCIVIETGEEFAVKIINFRGDAELRTLVINEFKNHRKLNQKNVVKVFKLYIDNMKSKIYTVMELVKCREMFEVVSELGFYCEAVASSIFKQILLAIQHLHSKGVCHRDLKPSNILVSDDGSIVKITDFNVSKFIDESKKKYTSLSKENFKMWTYTGTIAFTAPEVLNDTEYTEIVDMWSAGCVLYTMLCGTQPFGAEYLHDLIEQIKEGTVDYSAKIWEKISPDAKDLVQKLLHKDPKLRYSPSQALAHPWIVNVGKVPARKIKDVMENLRINRRKNIKGISQIEPHSGTLRPSPRFSDEKKKRRATYIESDFLELAQNERCR